MKSSPDTKQNRYKYALTYQAIFQRKKNPLDQLLDMLDVC